MKSYAITDVGKVRSSNQDSVFCSNSPIGILPNLFIVADGMGGHNAGDFASRFCVDNFVKKVAAAEGRTSIGTLEAALLGTGNELIALSREKEEYSGMGTTFVAASIFDKVMQVMNIGDSRLYLINHEITQITEDHSLVAEMVKSGSLNDDEARVHPKKNVVTRAITQGGIIIPDFFEVPIKNNDYILLCSDGLSSMLNDSEIFNIVKDKEEVSEIAKCLIENANTNGGKDNISVVLVQI